MGQTKEYYGQIMSEVQYPHSLIIEEQYYQIKENDTRDIK